MKLKEGFVLREVAGEKIVSGEGLEHINFNKLITLNPTAAYLWENVYGKEFDYEMLASLLTKRYEVDHATALKDAAALIEEWVKAGIAYE